jgi:hypothetical protein
VLSITEAAALNDKTIANWLAGQGAEMMPPVLSTPKTNHLSTINVSFMQSANRLVKLSQDFVYAARTGENVVEFVQALQAIDYIQLRSTLSADNEKKAFWINLYNGFTQNLLRQNPAQYKSRSRFFRKKQITVAGQQFSLDDIEHGILRRSKIKWSLGYLNKLFPSKTERELRVAHLDYRIHFALNCGAKSCPPIAFYAPEKLDQQLALATKSYLQGEVDYKDADKTFFLPAIMSWFRRDFGDKKGMRNLLQQHGFTNVHSSTRIAFKDYDWSLYLDNFKNL